MLTRHARQLRPTTVANASVTPLLGHYVMLHLPCVGGAESGRADEAAPPGCARCGRAFQQRLPAAWEVGKAATGAAAAACCTAGCRPPCCVPAAGDADCSTTGFGCGGAMIDTLAEVCAASASRMYALATSFVTPRHLRSRCSSSAHAAALPRRRCGGRAPVQKSESSAFHVHVSKGIC